MHILHFFVVNGMCSLHIGFKQCFIQSLKCCLNLISLFSVFRDRVVTLAICVYCTLSFVVIGYDELFSLWAATGPEHGKVFVLKCKFA